MDNDRNDGHDDSDHDSHDAHDDNPDDVYDDNNRYNDDVDNDVNDNDDGSGLHDNHLNGRRRKDDHRQVALEVLAEVQRLAIDPACG